MDLYAMIAAISRATTTMERAPSGVRGSEGPENGAVQAASRDRLLCGLFCERAHRRVRGVLKAIDDNDDEDLKALAEAAYAADGSVPDLFAIG